MIFDEMQHAARCNTPVAHADPVLLKPPDPYNEIRRKASIRVNMFRHKELRERDDLHAPHRGLDQKRLLKTIHMLRRLEHHCGMGEIRIVESLEKPGKEASKPCHHDHVARLDIIAGEKLLHRHDGMFERGRRRRSLRMAKPGTWMLGPYFLRGVMVIAASTFLNVILEMVGGAGL